ncbi:hypothetical protein [Streptomyces sp. NPDC020681]|uniref:hypothetical protein n=1 Tax=Streptomyces sp. NPDC020681 TaxID=3365083 RepID=UPI00378F39BE
MRTSMRRGMAAAVAVSALCFTAACGGSSDDEKKPAAGQEQSTDKATDKAEAPVTPLTAAQMKAATLEVKDLPTGWKAGTVTSTDDPAPKSDKPECQPIADLMADKIPGATMGQAAEFEGKGDESGLSEHVFTFPATGGADFVKAIGTALESCTKASFDAEGEKLAVTIAKLSTAKVGEESYAFRMTMPIPELGVNFTSDLLVARQGTGVVRLAHSSADPTKAAPFDDLAKRAGDKFVKGVQG